MKLLVSFHQVQVQVVPDDGTLRLQWEVSNKVSHVVVRAVSEREVVQVSIPAIEYKSLFQRNKYYHLKGLKSLTDYTLYFDVRSSNGARSQVVKRVRTKEDITAPKDRLQQVKVKKISGGIRISWDKESVKAGKTDIEQAMIRIKDITTNKVIKEVRVRDIEKGEVNILELGSKGGKIYDIGAIYEDRNGNKASSEDRLLTNIEISKLSNKESGIFFEKLSVEAKDKKGKEADESLHIKWGDFVYTDGKQVSVQVRETATEVLLLDTKIRETSEEKVSEAVERSNDYVSWYEAKDGVAVRKLYGIQEYSIEVSAYKNGVYFSGVEKKATTTDKQTESVGNISVVANATSIIVGWRSPAVRDYAGVEISVEKDGVLVVVKQETDNTVEQVAIRGLEERTTYNILVRSVDRAGNKGRAVVRNGITTRKDEEAPESPSDIRVNYMAVLSERVASTIGWQEPLRSKARNQDIKVYKLIIRKKEEGREIVSQEIAYPTIEYYTELLENTTEYSVSLYSEDYAGNTSGVTTKIIRTPSPIEAPEARVLEGLKPVLETSGEIQIVATFKEGAGEGEVYTISMYEGAIFIATKSIRGAAKEIRFGIGEGLEVPREKEQAKRYGFKLIKEVNGVVSSATDLTPSEEEKIEVYDSISTPPPAPKRAEILFEREINEREIRAKYRFTVGDFTSEYKALDGNVLKKDEVLYKVYVVEGDKRSRSGEEIKEQAIRTQAIPVLTVEGETTKTEHTVFFEGKRGTTYTAVIEAINKRNPSSYTHVEGGSETKQTIRLKIPHTVPKASSFADDNAVVYTVLETGKNVLTVAIKKADIEGVETTDGRELTDGDIAYYVLYAKAEELRRKPGSVEELWRAGKGGDSIVKYIKVIGDDRAVIRVEIVDSRSEGDMGSTPVEEAKDYYVGVRIVNTTAREYNANDSSKLFIDNYYGDIEEIKEVRSSQAEAPAKSLLEGILSVGRSTVREGAIKVELKELRDFTEGRDYAGKAISSNEELKYRVYGIQKETVPTEEEVLAVGKEVALGLASGGSYIQRAISVLGIAVPEQEAIEGGKSYHFVVEVAIATDESKKVLSSVASVETSGATAPGEVRAIRVASKAIRATVVWEAPALSTRHKSKTGEQLKTAEVSYKIYKRAKNGDTERTVEAIKTVDNSPQIVGAGTTRFELTGLTEDTSYELVVQAVNATDDTQESEGAKYEFKTKESFASPGIPTIQARANGNGINGNIRAPNDKGTAEDGTALRDEQIEYRVYYAPSNREIDAETVKTRAKEAGDVKAGGVKIIGGGVARYSIAGLHYGRTYYITVEAVNSFRSSKKSRPSIVVRVETGSAATASGEATVLTADESTERQLRFRAEAPRDTGTKADGLTVVEASALRYWLYYAKFGETSNGVSVTSTTSAADVVSAVGTVIHARNKDRGRIERDSRTLVDGFVLTGLTGGVKYRYTIVTVHPEGVRYNSAPAGAKTATVKSEATASGEATVLTADESTERQLRFTARAPMNTGTKADGTAVEESALRYWLYYAKLGETSNGVSVTSTTSAVDVVSAVGTVIHARGKDRGRIERTGRTLVDGFVLTGLTGGVKYRYTIVTVHPEGVRYNSAPAGAETATVKSEATASGEATVLTADESTERQLRFRAEAPRDTGKQADGTAVEANALRYWLYYAKLGETSNGVSVTSTTSAADVVSAVGTVTRASSKDRGRIERDGRTLVNGFVLTGLTGGVQYRYTIVTVHPEGVRYNSAPAGAKTATVKSEATASGEATVLTADDTMQKRLTFRARAPMNTGTKADGTAVEESALRYWLYYAKLGETSNGVSVTSTTSAVDVVSAVGTVIHARGKDRGRIERDSRTLADGFVLTGLTGGVKYRYTIVTVHPEGVRYNSAPAGAKTATVKSEATASGEATVLTADDTMQKRLTFTARAPMNTGTKADGTAVEESALRYWLYYAKFGETSNGVSVTSTTSAVDVVSAVGTVTNDRGKDRGRIERDGRTLVNGFVLTGLTGGVKYRYTIVTVHPEGVRYNSAPAGAKTATVKSEATAPGEVTSPTVTEQGDEIIVTATPPSDRGKKIDGSSVSETEIKYTLYYVKVGGDDGVPIQANAVGLIQAKAEETGLASTLAGKKALRGDTALATGFRIAGLTEDTLYQYFIRVTNSDDAAKYSDTSEVLVFTLKPRGGKAEVIQPTLEDGTPRKEIGNDEYKQSGTPIRHINIPRTITKIGEGAFQDNRLKRVVLPDSLEELGAGAFEGNEIEEVTFGSQLRSIPDGVFRKNRLRSLVIPDTVEGIDKNAFVDNNDLREVKLSKKLFDTIGAEEGGLAEVFGDQVLYYLDYDEILLGGITAPGEATILTADESTERQLRFRAEAPRDTGTQADGKTAVEANALRYWLYYAKLGETVNGVSVTSTTSAADVVSAVGTVTHASSKEVGRIERTGRTLADGFVLTGLTGGVKYRYTIVTVYPDPDSDKFNSAPAGAKTATVKSEATASGKATVLTADESTVRKLKFRARAPRDTGKQADGTAVEANALRYWLYYAKLGETSNGVSVTSTTSAADVVSAIGNVIHARNKDRGRIERDGRTLVNGFVLTGLTGGVKYRYTIVTVHPEGVRYNSAPAGAKTATVKLEATASGEATVLTADDTMQKRLTFRARAPSDTGKQADGTAVGANALRYWLYYAKLGETVNGVSVTSTTSAADVVSAIGNVIHARNKDRGRIERDGRTLVNGFVLTGLTGGVKYRYTIVTVHPEGVRYNSAPAGAKTATVKLEATASGEATILFADESTERQLRFTARAPSDTGKQADGTAVEANALRYWLYYAKLGETVNGVSVTSTTSAVDVVKAVETVIHARSKDRGRIERDGRTLVNGFVLTGLTGGVKYRYTIVTVHPEGVRFNSTPAGAKTAIVKSEATASGEATVLTADDTMQKRLTFTARAPSDTGKQADGTVVEVNALAYWLYYAKLGETVNGVSITSTTSATDVVSAVGTVTHARGKDRGRIERIGRTLVNGFVLTGLTGGVKYRYTIVTVHPEGVRFNSAPAPAETATVKSEATAPGEATVFTADDTMQKRLTFRAEAPSDTGKQADGTAVEANALRYWLYYAKVAARSNGIIVKERTSATDVIKAVGTVTNDMNKEVGRIERTGRTLVNGFVLIGLTGGVQYRYTIVTVHPEGVRFNSAPATAKTATVKSEATAPGVVTVLTADESTVLQLRFTARAPSDTGKQADGTAVEANALRYWLYYAKLGETVNGVSVTSTTSAADVVKAVGTVTNDMGKEVGRIEGTGRTLADGFVLTGLTGGVKYRYTIVTVHPEGVRYNSAPATAEIATVKNYRWTKVTKIGKKWSSRFGHATEVFDDKIWVLGGVNNKGEYKNDVWNSSDGVKWTEVTESAPWSGRFGHATVMFDDKLWVLGGVNIGNTYEYDVWNSSDGVKWTKVTEIVGFSGRSKHTMVVFKKKLWVLGGINNEGDFKNDVWNSSDGVKWTKVTEHADWSVRRGHATVVFDEKIWVLGGGKNDVWSSSDGVKWTKVTEHAGWSGRLGHTTVVFDDKLWVLGGGKNDVWSSSDGVKWTKVTEHADWSGRSEHTTVVFKKKPWVLGGIGLGWDILDDVWYGMPQNLMRVIKQEKE